MRSSTSTSHRKAYASAGLAAVLAQVQLMGEIRIMDILRSGGVRQHRKQFAVSFGAAVEPTSAGGGSSIYGLSESRPSVPLGRRPACRTAVQRFPASRMQRCIKSIILSLSQRGFRSRASGSRGGDMVSTGLMSEFG